MDIYYNEIKNKIINDEIYAKVKDYSKENHKVNTYFEIGKLLYEAGSKYGEDIIGKYSEQLVIDVGTKYNKRTLFRMKQFYILFNDKRVSTVWTQLNWSLIRELLSINNIEKINYYINKIITNNLSVRMLQKIIKENEYERLPNDTKLKLINEEPINIQDMIPNPIIIQNKNNYDENKEFFLKTMILENIDEFLKQLGNGFAYISNEYKIKLNNTFNYIDLLLYNIKFKCYVVIELKVTKLKKDHIGQIQLYMNYIDKNIKTISENKTIGIIICKKDNKLVMEYCSDERILTKEYLIKT